MRPKDLFNSYVNDPYWSSVPEYLTLLANGDFSSDFWEKGNHGSFIIERLSAISGIHSDVHDGFRADRPSYNLPNINELLKPDLKLYPRGLKLSPQLLEGFSAQELMEKLGVGSRSEVIMTLSYWSALSSRGRPSTRKSSYAVVRESPVFCFYLKSWSGQVTAYTRSFGHFRWVQPGSRPAFNFLVEDEDLYDVVLEAEGLHKSPVLTMSDFTPLSPSGFYVGPSNYSSSSEVEPLYILNNLSTSRYASQLSPPWDFGVEALCIMESLWP